MKRIDFTIPACTNTKTDTKISNFCILISSNTVIEPCENVFKLLKSVDINPKKKYRLCFRNKMNNTKRKREEDLLDEVNDMRHKIERMENDIVYLKQMVHLLMLEKGEIVEKLHNHS